MKRKQRALPSAPTEAEAKEAGRPLASSADLGEKRVRPFTAAIHLYSTLKRLVEN